METSLIEKAAHIMVTAHGDQKRKTNNAPYILHPMMVAFKLQELGFEARLPVSGNEVFNFRKEYIKNKNLIAWSFYNPKEPSEIVDIIITHDLAKLKKKKISLNKFDIFILSKKAHFEKFLPVLFLFTLVITH